MGKKKSGAKNKLAKMSEEERARYLQHRADIEEEARRRKQQLIALYMKNKLKREDAFSRLNLAKINQEWRSILRQLKCCELKNEIMEVERLFQESLAQKNHIIRRLLGDLDEAEELYSNLQQSYMESTERLVQIQSERMNYFKNSYSTQQTEILEQCEKDFDKFQRGQSKSQIELECIYFALEDVGEKKLKEMDEDHLNHMDDLKSKMAIRLEKITKSREENLEILWKEYQKILNDYIKYTDAFYAEYSELRERDEESTHDIRSHCYEVNRLTDQMAELKFLSENATEEANFQIGYLEKYRKSLNEKFFSLKFELEKKINFDEDQFRYMGVAGHNAIMFLKNIYKKGESILQLASICRHLESEREKIFPFEGLQSIVLRKNPLQGETKNNSFQSCHDLEIFWARLNKIRLDNACLSEEQQLLKKRNRQLKFQLKDYLAKITIAAGCNDSNFYRVHPRSSSIKVEKVLHTELNHTKRLSTAIWNTNNSNKKNLNLKTRPHTCIEANLSNAVRSVNIIEAKMPTVKFGKYLN